MIDSGSTIITMLTLCVRVCFTCMWVGGGWVGGLVVRCVDGWVCMCV